MSQKPFQNNAVVLALCLLLYLALACLWLCGLPWRIRERLRL
jgi:hypothetical protein